MLKIGIIGFAVYFAAAAIVLQFYQADPENMSWQERETFNLKQIGRLNLRAPRDAVTRLLRSPDISEAQVPDRRDLLVLFYRPHHVKSEGITTRDECTPLLFEAAGLIACGAHAYSCYQS